VTDVFEALLAMQSTYACAGSSRALRTASENVIRVVATPMPEVEISWVNVDKTDRLYVNFQYVLWDEHGEMHPPKDPNRNEVELEPALETALRQQVMSDLILMHKKGFPLSPGFLRQMGHREEATALEAILLNQPELVEVEELQVQGEAASSALTVQPATVKKGLNHFEVETILDQRASTGRAHCWYLVRWAGYHPT
jgi:hypothetical protein